MIKVGIIGAAGYTAGELIRILIYHPFVEIVFANSQSQAGKPVADIHKDLIGEINLVFTNTFSKDIDVLFLCSGHAFSKKFIQENDIPEAIKIIDLSQDFRLKHDASGFVYGLPELQKGKITTANKIANPGCFATAIQLALLPLAKHQKLNSDVHIHGITGSTGAGQKPTDTTHFSWRTNNLSSYKVFHHQHLKEIYQSLHQCQQGLNAKLHFIPIRGNFSRGIFITAYMDTDLDERELNNLFQTYYQPHPFVHILSGVVDLKQVINTNKCLLQVQKIDGKLFITSIIDNLIKGASGQAIQNMNLMFGIPETTGLLLKNSAF